MSPSLQLKNHFSKEPFLFPLKMNRREAVSYLQAFLQLSAMNALFASMCGLLLPVSCTRFSLEKISCLTSSVPGSGMDGGLGCIEALGGGSYNVRVCQGFSCCDSGRLNTEDDNWELGQVDWFVGRQIGPCSGAMFNYSKPVTLTLLHQGGNSGTLQWIKLYSWQTTHLWTCILGVGLDKTDQHRVTCTPNTADRDDNRNQDLLWCNGRKEFCKLNFKQFLFPGTHNSGTGQYRGVLRCAFKNQDLDIKEQLDFGIRFFDLDVIYSTKLLNCNGLATGHGRYPSASIYQCYGAIDTLLADVKVWMDLHGSEVIILYFGNIAWPGDTVPRLKKNLLDTFPSEGDGVKMNTEFKSRGEWPTLGKAVRDNRRVFVFIRDESVNKDEMEFVREIKVKPGDKGEEKQDEGEEKQDDKSVTILSGYSSKTVGSDCGYVVNSSRTACETEADLVKLSLFSSFGKGQRLGTECLWDMAKKCNQWVKESLAACTGRNVNPNFVLVDYPNYQGTKYESFVNICEMENLVRASKI